MEENRIIIPPIKCQGIKTKLVDFIKHHVRIEEDGVWIEPFLGSGVVLFNVQPKKAIVSDKNQYIIELYKSIQNGTITPLKVKEFLEFHGKNLEQEGAAYYKKMRDEFNKNKDPMYFLFLNRADFNGMIRFNKNGNFNVPFCQKPNRFARSYITKICNQVKNIQEIMKGKDWEFVCCNWQETIKRATEKDYIYLDPPYIGRDTSYVGEWPMEEAIELADYAHKTKANVCLSMWKENEFRKNEYLDKYWSDFVWHDTNHFYHFGGKEENRHPMIEVLAIKK